MHRNKDGGYLLPEIIDPERICIQIYVPNDFNHLLAFWAQLEGLGSAIQWGNDEDHTALDVAAVWRDVYAITRDNYFNGGCGMPCADDMCDKLDTIIDILKAGFLIVPNINLATDFSGGSCAPAFFDHDTDEDETEVLEQRQKALCITVERYIKALMRAALVDMSAPEFLVDYLEGNLLSDIPLSLNKVTAHYPLGFLGLAVFYAIVTATLSFEPLVCIFASALTGEKNNTFLNFKNAIPTIVEGLDELLVPLIGLIRESNKNKDNYTSFNIALNDANNEDLAGYECPCELGGVGDCSEPLDMIFKNDRGISIENVGGDLYHIIGGHKFGSGGEFGGVYLQDSSNRCFALEIPTGTEPGLPPGWTGVQPTSYHFVIGCCGSSDHSGAGGWENGAFTEAYWDCGDTTDIDTYYILRCMGADCQ